MAACSFRVAPENEGREFRGVEFSLYTWLGTGDACDAVRLRSKKTPVLDICGSHRPVADGNIEFVNAAALNHRDKGKIPKCRWIIDER